MRIGIFGGSFDPVHFGHLLAAECCREQANLDEVWFVPLATPAHKPAQEISPPQGRLAMLNLAITEQSSFRASTIELDRAGISYTVDTLDQIRQQQPQDELFLVLGADSLADFSHWRQAPRICELASLLVVRREGYPEPDFSVLQSLAPADRIKRFRALQVEMPAVGLSARNIRARVAARQSIRYRTPHAVVQYIQTHGLYAQPAAISAEEPASAQKRS